MTIEELDEIDRIKAEPDPEVRDRLMQQFSALGSEGRELLFRLRRDSQMVGN